MAKAKEAADPDPEPRPAEVVGLDFVRGEIADRRRAEASIEKLEAAARRVLDALAARPHIFNLGHGILQDTPIAHVEALLALVKGAR